MHVDKLEKLWIYIVGFIIAGMLASIFYTAFAVSVHPPSNVETIDSQRLHLTEEFAEDNLGATSYVDATLSLPNLTSDRPHELHWYRDLLRCIAEEMDLDARGGA